ncbi:MAG: dihydrofolate reductase [Candidatus Komeilibacteria bacterium]
MPRLSTIVAIDKKRGIGKDNKLLCHISNDLKRFKKITTGHTILMGSTTYESIGKPLPNRINVVVAFDPDYKAEGCVVFNDLDEAITWAKNNEPEEVFITGGASIYKQTIDKVDRLYLTIIDEEFEADTFFPEYDQFTRVIKEESGKDGEYNYKFIILEK